MAKAAWSWKPGLLGLVILVVFLYLVFVEWRRGDLGRESLVQPAPAADSAAEVRGAESGVAQSVTGIETGAGAAGEERAAVEPAASGEVGGVPRPLSQNGGARTGAVEATVGRDDFATGSVSQAEARAFASAVLTEDGAEPGEFATASPIGPAAVFTVANESVSESPAVQPPASLVTAGRTVPAAPAADSVASEVSMEPSIGIAMPSIPTVAITPPIHAVVPEAADVRGTALPPSAPGTEADAAAVPMPETPVQRHARIMAEYQAMQQAAWETMRKRWSRSRGAYPYGAYPPQWGYSQWGQPRTSAPDEARK